MHSFLLLILSHDFQFYFSRYGYIGIYIFFVTIDQIAPIPEEITLIVIGYFGAQDVLSPIMAGAFSLAAFLTIDIIYYFLAKTGNKLVKKLVKKSSTNPVLKRYKGKLKKHLLKTLLILSFIPRVRLLSPVFAALSGAPFRNFIIYNSMSQAFFIAVYISIGLVFHSSLSSVLEKLGTYRHFVFIGFVVLMVALSIVITKKIVGRKSVKT